MVTQYQASDFTKEELEKNYELFRKLFETLHESQLPIERKSRIVTPGLMVLCSLILLITGTHDSVGLGIVLTTLLGTLIWWIMILRKSALKLACKIEEVLAGRKDVGYLRWTTFNIYRQWQEIAETYKKTDPGLRSVGLIRFVSPPKWIRE